MSRRFATEFEIAGRPIGPAYPPYVIAEMSGNHGGELATAMRILESAKQAGADAVKLQSYTADTITINSNRPEFVVQGGLWGGRTLHDLYREAHTPWEWHGALFARAKELGLVIFSSPFDRTAVDLLDKLGAPAFKIASLEICDTPLIRYAAERGKPMIVSTGASEPRDVEEALDTMASAGCREVVLLHCLAAYPAPVEEFALRTIPAMAERYNCPVGLSDHSHGLEAALAATALGAVVVEKHITNSRAAGAVDSAFSLEPTEFAAMVRGTKTVHGALGTVRFSPAPSEVPLRRYRRSLYVVSDIRKGEAFTPANVRSIRPSNGLMPRHYDRVIGGAHATQDIAAGTPLEPEMLDIQLPDRGTE